MATNVTVIYHYEDGAWWADSEDVPRWSAAAPELEELVELVSDGVPFALEAEDVEITHRPAPDLMDVFNGRTAGARTRILIAEAFAGFLSVPEVLAVNDAFVVPAGCGS